MLLPILICFAACVECVAISCCATQGEICDIDGTCVDAADDEVFKLTTKEGSLSMEREKVGVLPSCCRLPCPKPPPFIVKPAQSVKFEMLVVSGYMVFSRLSLDNQSCSHDSLLMYMNGSVEVHSHISNLSEHYSQQALLDVCRLRQTPATLTAASFLSKTQCRSSTLCCPCTSIQPSSEHCKSHWHVSWRPE